MKIYNKEHNTNPLVLHYNGHQKEILTDEYVDLLIGNNELKIPDNLTILTYATNNIVNRCPLIKQLNKHNVEFLNLCDLYGSDNWNNTFKIKHLCKYLNEYDIKTKYVLVLDANDIILSDNFHTIVDEFEKMDIKIYYGATVNRYPDVKLEPIENKGYYKYLNSGTVIAEPEYLKDFINICNDNLDDKKNFWKSDQYEIRKNYVNYDKKIISYDYETKLFITSGRMYQTEKNFNNDTLIIENNIKYTKHII